MRPPQPPRTGWGPITAVIPLGLPPRQPAEQREEDARAEVRHDELRARKRQRAPGAMLRRQRLEQFVAEPDAQRRDHNDAQSFAAAEENRQSLSIHDATPPDVEDALRQATARPCLGSPRLSTDTGLCPAPASPPQ